MLHIVNQSPFTSNSLESCLRVAQSNDVILLIEDAVLAVGWAELAKPNKFTIYALKSDIEARGLSDKVIAKIKLIDYAEFVELTVQHHPIQTWS